MSVLDAVGGSVTPGAGGSVMHLVVGPERHGVVIFARWLARETAGAGPVTHLNYTEALFGPDTTSAAQAFAELVGGLAGRVTVTLHDLPDPGDEPGRYRRRAAGFRRVVEAVDGVCVSSEHEHRRLTALLGDAAGRVPVQVIPLPIAAAEVVPPVRRPRPDGRVAVFGYIYPGKGHAELLGEMAGLPGDIGVVALGRAADGHDDLVRNLHGDRPFEVTGYLPDADLGRRLREVAVPVVPAPSVSASGSLNTWIAAGRRPLVVDSDYGREFATDCPHLV
ncbi:glycosyltransferase family protein, partial [Kineosporia succinea]